MEDLSDDETFMVSSDTESECGDESRLFYDDESNSKMQIKHTLKAFDSNTCVVDGESLNSMYQEKFMPMLKNKNNHEFFKWLIEVDLLSCKVSCESCSESSLKIVLAFGKTDKYQLRCKSCLHKESVRKNSIFEGIKCNVRSFIRCLYGWVIGTDVDIMANMLGLPKKIVGSIYNRASSVALGRMTLCPTLLQFGGDDMLILVDIYPMFLETVSPSSQRCHPVLCISEIETIPQKYWLEPLPLWNKNNQDEVESVKKLVVDIIVTLVRPRSILILPSSTTLPLEDILSDLSVFYPSVRPLDELLRTKDSAERFQTILDTIWRKPVEVCERAQYHSPEYMTQYFIRRLWNELNDCDAFSVLMSIIVEETQLGTISELFQSVSFIFSKIA